LVFALLGTVSGLLGSQFAGSGYGIAPHPGLYMVLVGLWFGLAIGFATWLLGGVALASAMSVVLTTWIAWEAAVNVAMQVDAIRSEMYPAAAVFMSYATGFAAGAAGALITWAGVAAHLPELRRGSTAATIIATGAVFGLLLPATNSFDTGAVLLLPWQAAVAAMIGRNLSPSRVAWRLSLSAER
jgi:hypothetical protein